MMKGQMRYLPCTDDQLKEAMLAVYIASDYTARVKRNPLAWDQSCVPLVVHAHEITKAEAMKKLNWLKRGPFRSRPTNVKASGGGTVKRCPSFGWSIIWKPMC